ncbi:hypothetical protein U2F10_10195 [Leptothoe sp. EHU-05/26/07-4]
MKYILCTLFLTLGLAVSPATAQVEIIEEEVILEEYVEEEEIIEEAVILEEYVEEEEIIEEAVILEEELILEEEVYVE